MDIPEKYKQLWICWDVRAFILFSVSIQIILIFLGHLRKTFALRWMRMVLWGSYLIIDLLADFVLFHLCNAMDDSSFSNAIVAFWAPFLILHLGGPDTITAYSIEDNELWAQRSYSLYKASNKGFHRSICSSYRKPSLEDLNPSNQTFFLYSACRPFFINHIPNLELYRKTRNLINDMTTMEVWKVMSMVLGYVYDEFYTKEIINHSIVGYGLRVLCSICIFLAFWLFLMVPKDDFGKFNVTITYILLVTSMCLDATTTIMLVFSNWMVSSLLGFKKLRNWNVLLVNCIVRIQNAWHKKSHWLIKMPQLCLLNNCLNISAPNGALHKSKMNWIVEKLSFAQETKLYPGWRTIINESYTLQTLQPTHANEEIMKIIASDVINCLTVICYDRIVPGYAQILKFNKLDWAIPIFVELLDGMSLDQQVFIWHITTELCFHWNPKSVHPLCPHLREMEEEENISRVRTCLEMETCKYLSNYMMHTVLMRPEMMSTIVQASPMLFYHAFDDMVKFIHNYTMQNAKVEEVCRKIMATPIVWTDNNRSLFAIALALADLMLKNEEDERWQVLTMTWAELIIQVAKNSRASMHMKQLSSGDKLLTFIWLLNKLVETDDMNSLGDIVLSDLKWDNREGPSAGIFEAGSAYLRPLIPFPPVLSWRFSTLPPSSLSLLIAGGLPVLSRPSPTLPPSSPSLLVAGGVPVLCRPSQMVLPSSPSLLFAGGIPVLSHPSPTHLPSSLFLLLAGGIPLLFRNSDASSFFSSTNLSAAGFSFAGIFYLIADLLADFVLFHLCNDMDDSSFSNAIVAFWAPFLILHLSGPDTITAYSMEDNELWARHLFSISYRLIMAFYILFRSLPNTCLLAPTLLIFLVAIVKYLERSYSLYKASTKGFHSSICSSYRKPSLEDLNPSNQTFFLYSACRPFFINHIPNLELYRKIRNLINDMTTMEVWRAMSMVLGYVYDEFYTKAIINHSIVGYGLRVLCSICIFLAFWLFLMVPKDSFGKFNVTITYILLVTSTCLDVTAIIMLVFSNWMVSSLLGFKKLRNWNVLLVNCIVRIQNAWHKKSHWLIKMPQLCLLNNCLNISAPNGALHKSKMNWIVEKLSFAQETKLYPGWRTIINESYTLQTLQPSHANEEIMKIIASDVINCLTVIHYDRIVPGYAQILKFNKLDWAIPIFVELLDGMSLDQQVFIWHITTELCFHWNPKSIHPLCPHQREMEEEESISRVRKCLEMETCKYLSNYMMHTVLMRPDMMSTTAQASPMLFYHAFDDMVKFIRSYTMQNAKVEEVCRKIMATPIVWTDNNRSLFGIARALADLMLKNVEDERWKVLTMTWAELIIQVAKNSRANMHMKQLSSGDKLLTSIWLLNKLVETDDMKLTYDSQRAFIKDQTSAIRKSLSAALDSFPASAFLAFFDAFAFFSSAYCRGASGVFPTFSDYSAVIPFSVYFRLESSAFLAFFDDCVAFKFSVLWGSYFIADLVANFILAQLSNTMDDSSISNVVVAFWAPFLILHLGGPDTINAYSMEDNELWASHLLSLGYELSLPSIVVYRNKKFDKGDDNIGVPKDGFGKFDVTITYILLVTSICLDVTATNLLVFSD
ncbi:hypothetical protein IEQ34_001155 [Dendrobium chrysotoxum]|uniref:DUF4220 domain-containing protein n=1 Tax=Dendrobium chrysotoxum TaxID=161865 RepID=A0AAV7HMI5_DENCH|nr:hypothetical protein IEQ34_001155 [Dendrobium chrysotoxum]